MASRRAFGRTWWGSAWVEAMELIDRDTNRLPRGRTYARDGSVLEIGVEGSTVHALVQGRRRDPYEVSFRVKPFTRAEVSKVKLLLSDNPALACALGLGKLPERMLDMLAEAGVHLFPRSWKDLEAHCSCPDWANPCKHLAAVYYLVANEIDKDPFMVFQLRGLPVSSLRLEAEPAETAWEDEPGEAERDSPAFIPWREAEAAPLPEGWVDLDLCFPRLDLEAIFALLEDAPLFWEGGDFKKALRGAYRAVAAAAEDPDLREEFPSLRGVDFYLLHEDSVPSRDSGGIAGPDKGTGVRGKASPVISGGAHARGYANVSGGAKERGSAGIAAGAHARGPINAIGKAPADGREGGPSYATGGAPVFFVALDGDGSPGLKWLLGMLPAAGKGEPDQRPENGERAAANAAGKSASKPGPAWENRAGKTSFLEDPAMSGPARENRATIASPPENRETPGPAWEGQAGIASNRQTLAASGPAREVRAADAPSREGPAMPVTYRRKLPTRRESRLELVTRKGVLLDADTVLDFFLSLPLETDLRRYSPSARALCAASALALALARSHLYVPELVPFAHHVLERRGAPRGRTGSNAHGESEKGGKSRQTRKKGRAEEEAGQGAGVQGGFRVRYAPLLGEEKVKRALEALESLLPPELAFKRKGQCVPAPGYARYLVALFLHRVVRRHAGLPRGLEGDKLLRAFFAGEPYIPGGFAEQRTMAAVTNWLEKLYIRGKAVSPVVRVELIEAPARAHPGGTPPGPSPSRHDDSGSSTRFLDPGSNRSMEEISGAELDVSPHDIGLFGLHLDVEDREDPMAPMLSLAEVFAAEDEVFSRPAAAVKRDLARQIAVAGEYLPQLADILNSRGVMSAVIGPAEMAELLTRHASVLGVLGIRLVLPRELAKLLSPRLALRASLPGSPKAAVKHLSLAQMLDFDWEVSIGNAALSREEFLELARSAGGVVRFREGYVLLDPAEAARLLEKMSKPPPRPEPAEFLHWLLAGERGGVELRADGALEKWFKRLTSPEEPEVPGGLAGELRPYQERGYAWLYTNAVRGLGSCLADDMGLGKTIQAIALLLALRERGGLPGEGDGGRDKAGSRRKGPLRHVRGNAASAKARGEGGREAASVKAGGGLESGGGENLDRLESAGGKENHITEEEDGRHGGRPHLVVCPTSVVGNWHKEVRRFAPSLRASVYHGSERQLRTSGVDLVITTYGILRRDLEKFKARRWGALIIDEAQNIKNPSTAQARAVKALKAECRVALSGTPVENHLGELWSIFDFLNPGYLGSLDAFRKAYAAPIEKYRDGERIERLRRVTSPFIMRRLKSDKSVIPDLPEKITAEEYCYLTPQQAALYQRVVDEVMEMIESSEGMRRRGNILKLITSLKQICDHPALFAKRGKVESRLSGKAARCLSLLENVLAAGEKALVFTQYVEMGELLLRMIEEELGVRPLFFHGGVARGARDEMVRAFQEDGGHPIMLVSLRAGGTGLNLTAASNVVHYDLWWNPAVEEQATDRAYRIGQERNVYVHRLITLNTFEERIDEMMRAKRELAELTVSAGERWITELSDRELRDIFSLRSDA